MYHPTRTQLDPAPVVTGTTRNALSLLCISLNLGQAQWVSAWLPQENHGPHHLQWEDYKGPGSPIISDSLVNIGITRQLPAVVDINIFRL